MTARSVLRLALFCVLIMGLSRSALALDEIEQKKPGMRAVMHVHTHHSHDSTLSLRLLLDEAGKMGLDFVIVADHNSMEGISEYQKMKKPEKPILIFGDEISSSAGHLLVIGIKQPPAEDLKSPAEIASWAHAQGGLVILPHSCSAAHPWADWDFKDWDGIEVYNFGHQLYEQNAVDFYLRSFSEDSDELLKSFLKINREPFKRWDAEIAVRPVIGTAGTDAHLKKNEKTFQTALQSAIVYVQTKTTEENSILSAIKAGKLFTAFESVGKFSDFSFSAQLNGKTYQMGETAELPSGASILLKVRIQAALSETPKIKLFRNGKKVIEVMGTELDQSNLKPGAYRVEVYKGDSLWIFSNPIYFRSPSVETPPQA